MIYDNLSEELDHFDYQKELELREIFVEYTTLKTEHYEKVLYDFSTSINCLFHNWSRLLVFIDFIFHNVSLNFEYPL